MILTERNRKRRYSVIASLALGMLLPVGMIPAAEVTRSLISVPAPEVLGHGSVALSLDGRYFPDPPDIPEDQMAAWGPMARLGVGVLGRGEVGIDMVSAFDSMDNASAYVRILALEEGRYRPAVGVGIFDLGYDKTPNMDVTYPAIGPCEYLDDNTTNNSAYIVLAKFLPEIKGIPAKGRVYLGNGRGRFRAQSGEAEALYGTFFGGEMLISPMCFTAELDGRSIYLGIGINARKFRGQGYEISVNGMLQGRYLQHAREVARLADLRPAVGGRLEVVVTPLPGVDFRKKKAVKKKAANKPILITQ